MIIIKSQLAASVLGAALLIGCSDSTSGVQSPPHKIAFPNYTMTDPTQKSFRLRSDQIRTIAPGYGGCISTDMITCGGRKVGFMYRETQDNDADSGWRFMSGYESDEYMNDADNHAVYDVNTIANYDPDIIPLLKAPVGSAFERENGTGPFIKVHDFEPPVE